jgi:hypothetical protein
MTGSSPDAFETLAEQLRVMDTFERDRVVHWADPLFRGLTLERKVVTSLLAEAAARRAEAGEPLGEGVMLLDLQACGGAMAAVQLVRQVLPEAPEVVYVGFGTPAPGRRRLIARGLSELTVRQDGPAVRSAFHSASFFDLGRVDDALAAAAERYGWVAAVGFEGRVGRRGHAPLQPASMRHLSVADAFVVSFLDPDVLAAQHMLLTLLASSLEQPLALELDAVRDGEVASFGRVVIEGAGSLEPSRLELSDGLESVSRFAHRVRMGPAGPLRASGEVVEYDSLGFVEDHLLAGFDVSRTVPAGAVRACLVDRLDAPRAVV